MNLKKRLLFAMLTLMFFGQYLMAQMVDHPNVILILTDDQGYGDLGITGNPHAKTPVIDQLATESVRFNQFYVSPVCSPTRSSLMTGRYSLRTGMRDTYNGGATMASNEFTIAEMLKQGGYKTGVFGKWHLGDNYPCRPMEQGFDESVIHLSGGMGQVGDITTYFRGDSSYFDPVLWHNAKPTPYKGYCSDIFTSEAIDFIEQNQDSHFFCYLAFNAPHTPLQGSPEDLKLYRYDDTKPGYSKKKGEKELGHGNTREQTYAAMVTGMDRGIGNILQALKDLEIEDNTLVLFFSDNGADEGSGGGSSDPLREHKFHEFDGGVRVPAIIHWPARFEAPRVVDQLTGFVDVFPTLTEIIEPQSSTKPAEFDGISILEVLDQKEEEIDRSFYLGCGALIENDWKIIRAGQNPRMKLSQDVLFNLIDDPYEENDLSEKHREVMNRLTEQVLKYDTIKSDKEVLPFGEGRNDFVAPKEWNIFIEN